MDPAALIFASASLPIFVFHAARYREERALESIYGIFSGLFAFSGAITVAYGFPGNTILPATFGILALGSAHAYLKGKEKKSLIKAGAFTVVFLMTALMEVLL